MHQENWLASLLCNIILPILILNRLSIKVGPQTAVILALLFPLIYGGYYLYKNRKVNPISILGLLNVMVTGTFALTGLTGIWFAFKEAAFPTLIGIFVLGSSWTRRPFMQTMILNPQVMEVDKLEARLAERQSHDDFHRLLQWGTRGLAGSFFLSAVINFYLASRIFLEIDPNLAEAERSVLLNSQIAAMTGWAAVFTVLPSMILMTILLFWLLKKMEKVTGEPWQTYMKS